MEWYNPRLSLFVRIFRRHLLTKSHVLSPGQSFKINCYSTMEPLSGLAFIEISEPSKPFALFKKWLEEAEKHGKAMSRLMNLATSSKNGDVSNRTVLLREITEDGGLVIVTPTAGQKNKNIVENPKVAACFLWMYSKENKRIVRQVRFEGSTEQLSQNQCKSFYDREPLYCQIRSHICDQGQKVDWDDLKARHDELLKEVVEKDRKLEMPQNLVGYKIVPNKIDFYLSWDNSIGDRVVFEKDGASGWNCERVCV